jgi:L-threonylcarbamoyladenylate synthase
LDQLDFPVAAPSANPSTGISPTTAQHVEDMFGANTPYVLDGGDCEVGLESTIVGIHENTIQIYREGAVTREMIEEHFDNVEVSDSDEIKSPGQMLKHYAPKKRLHMFNSVEEVPIRLNTALFLLNSKIENTDIENVMYLSKDGNLDEVAKNLFSILHEADKSDYNEIVGFYVEDVGIGRAINDKLKRASYSAT